MKIDTRVIAEHLRKQRDQDRAAKAESDLADQVDIDHHSEKLSDLSLRTASLVALTCSVTSPSLAESRLLHQSDRAPAPNHWMTPSHCERIVTLGNG